MRHGCTLAEILAENVRTSLFAAYQERTSTDVAAMGDEWVGFYPHFPSISIPVDRNPWRESSKACPTPAME